MTENGIAVVTNMNNLEDPNPWCRLDELLNTGESDCPVMYFNGKRHSDEISKRVKDENWADNHDPVCNTDDQRVCQTCHTWRRSMSSRRMDVSAVEKLSNLPSYQETKIRLLDLQRVSRACECKRPGVHIAKCSNTPYLVTTWMQHINNVCLFVLGDIVWGRETQHTHHIAHIGQSNTTSLDQMVQTLQTLHKRGPWRRMVNNNKIVGGVKTVNREVPTQSKN